MTASASRAERLKSLIGASITAIVPAGGADQRLKVRVGRRVATVLRPRDVEELNLREGGVIDRSLVEAMLERERLGSALDAAMKWLARRRSSRAGLAERLAAKGFEAPIVSRAVERLSESGLLDDEAFARESVEQLTRRAPAGPAHVRATLARRGVAEDIIERVVREGLKEGEMEVQWRQLIGKRLQLMGRQTPAARARRLLAFLRRRGVEPDLADRLVREAVGLDE